MERGWMNRHMDAISTALAGVGGATTLTFKDSGVYDAMGALGDLGAFFGGVAAFGALIMAVIQYSTRKEEEGE